MKSIILLKVKNSFSNLLLLRISSIPNTDPIDKGKRRNQRILADHQNGDVVIVKAVTATIHNIINLYSKVNFFWITSIKIIKKRTTIDRSIRVLFKKRVFEIPP